MQKFCCKLYIFISSPIEQCHQRTEISSFHCGEVLISHWRISGKVMDSAQNPVRTPAMRLILSEKKPFALTRMTRPAGKSERQACHFAWWEGQHENFIPESIAPNIIENVLCVKKSSHYMFSLVESFHKA